MEEKLEQLKNVHQLAGSDGSWNYNSYSLGLFNGIEFALAIIEDRDPDFKQAPEIWLDDLPIEQEPFGVS